MDVSLHMLLIVCPLVFLAGLVDSIGGGGGLISLPAYLFAGIPPHMAIATNKLSSSLGTTISAARLFRYMDLPLAGACVVCSLIGSWGGSSLALLASEKLIQYMLLPVLPVVAYYVLRKKDLDHAGQKQLSRRKTFLICMPVSLLVGTYDGFYGPGLGCRRIYRTGDVFSGRTLQASAEYPFHREKILSGPVRRYLQPAVRGHPYLISFIEGGTPGLGNIRHLVYRPDFLLIKPSGHLACGEFREAGLQGYCLQFVRRFS